MVYGFVKQSGGHVKVYSEVGQGTTIRLYLPRAQAPASTAAGIILPATSRPRSGHETILVVEDDAAVRRLAASILEELGYKVCQAPDGKSALDLLRGPDHIDLVFTDMVMPNGVSGQDLIRAARLLRPGIRALLTSGYSAHFVTSQQDLGGIQLLSKPYRRDMLASAIRGALSSNR
jgi:CheY-like chemotaxis protein